MLSRSGRTQVHWGLRRQLRPPLPRRPQPRFPRGLPARLGSGSPLARPRPSALRAARQRHRHAEIPEVPPRRPPGHAAACPSPPPSALRARRAFPSTGRIPSSSGRPRDKTFPARRASSAPRLGYSQTRRQTKEPRENLPELQRKSPTQSFLDLTFNFKNSKSRNQKPPRLEVGVRGNARGRRFIPWAALAPPFLAPAWGFEVI